MDQTASTANQTSGYARRSHVVFLVNFVAPNHVEVLRNIAKSVGKLTILSSVAMESNRDWRADVGDLNVVVQKTKTISATAKHPSGFSDANYIHIPWRTTHQLRELNPDVVVSLEMGARTAFSAFHRALSRKCAFVMSVYASEQSEAGRGFLRRALRRQLVRRADWVTFNGPSCKRYLQSIGAPENRMSAWNYAADPAKPFRGKREFKSASDEIHKTSLLTVGQLSERKGILEAARQLSRWAAANGEHKVQWNVVGTGPKRDELLSTERPDNLEILFHDHCDAEQLCDFYRNNDVLLFPTLGDEWGLVTDEALHSGLPVVGSIHAQSVTTLIQDGVNGWRYDPNQNSELSSRLDQLVTQSTEQRVEMSAQARQSVRDRTPEHSAEQFVAAVNRAIEVRHGYKKYESSGETRDNSLTHEMTVA